jgi:ubiquinone/menaquinone biosynthesis C-methylase UbiE
MKQRDIFLESEGDAWYRRNSGQPDARYDPAADFLISEISALPRAGEIQQGGGIRLLEIGCGDGARLEWLQDSYGFNCSGLEPSEQAVEVARERGVDAHRGTAEDLPFGVDSFDIVVFGFCLYLCDHEDLFRIASEADRVLKNPGWLLILDFYSRAISRRTYHHRPGLYSHKMDYSEMFAWHPAYTVFSHRVLRHGRGGYTDDQDEWVAVSVLRKNLAGAD